MLDKTGPKFVNDAKPLDLEPQTNIPESKSPFSYIFMRGVLIWLLAGVLPTFFVSLFHKDPAPAEPSILSEGVRIFSNVIETASNRIAEHPWLFAFYIAAVYSPLIIFLFVSPKDGAKPESEDTDALTSRVRHPRLPLPGDCCRHLRQGNHHGVPHSVEGRPSDY